MIFNLTSQLPLSATEETTVGEQTALMPVDLNRTAAISYPLISNDKQQLDSVLYNNNNDNIEDGEEEGESAYNARSQVITMSCFARPKNTAKHRQKHVNLDKLPDISYNLKLVPKQKGDKMLEMLEIEKIKRELAKKQVNLGTNVL